MSAGLKFSFSTSEILSDSGTARSSRPVLRRSLKARLNASLQIAARATAWSKSWVLSRAFLISMPQLDQTWLAQVVWTIGAGVPGGGGAAAPAASMDFWATSCAKSDGNVGSCNACVMASNCAAVRSGLASWIS